MTETAWLDFVNPVDVSSTWGDWGSVQGAIVGDADCLRTDDGDTSFVSVSNGYDFQELDASEQPYYRDGGYSRTFQVDLEPDSTLPATVDSYDIRWVLTGAVTIAGSGVNVERLTPGGSEIIGSFNATGYTEDVPRGSIFSGPSWAQIRSDGWQMPFRGLSRILDGSQPFGYARITQMRLQVTYTLLSAMHAPPLRQYPRSDGLGASSARRVWPPSPSIQASNRRVGGYL